jgi:adenosylhomocysteine nucleosidase
MRRLVALLALLALRPAAALAQPRVSLAVLGAMPVEVELLRARLQHPVVRTIEGIPFVEGTLGGKRVVVVRAGVGKVNAGVTTALLLEHFRPPRVLFTGVAGALDTTLALGDLVLASATAEHDLGMFGADGMSSFGATPASDTVPNPIRFPGDTLLLRVARDVARREGWHAREGAVVTGDVFVANDSLRRVLRRRFPDAVAVEMEGAAVAQVCWQTGRVPLLVVRSISDGAGTGAHESFEQFARRAAERSSELVTRLVEAIP